jgi:uncharacterized protein
MVRTIDVRAKPGSKENVLAQEADGRWIARVKAQPIDGKANEALIKLIAEHFGLRQSQVRLERGAASKLKRFVIDSE